jgi:hypothetical protein
LPDLERGRSWADPRHIDGSPNQSYPGCDWPR